MTSDDTIKESEGGEADVQEASPTPDTSASAASEETDVAQETDLQTSVMEKSFDLV